jgi:hypothetical protein
LFALGAGAVLLLVGYRRYGGAGVGLAGARDWASASFDRASSSIERASASLGRTSQVVTKRFGLSSGGQSAGAGQTHESRLAVSTPPIEYSSNPMLGAAPQLDPEGEHFEYTDNPMRASRGAVA